MAIALVLVACQDASTAPPPHIEVSRPAVVHIDASIDAGRNPCELFVHYIDHLGRCTKLPEEARRQFQQTAAQLKSALHETDPTIAKICDTGLKDLRDAAKELCPQLLEALPEAPE